MRPNSHTIIHFFYVSDSSSALTLLTTDTFWLSQAPFTPGSWFPGAGTPRLATIAHFCLSAGTSTGTGGAELLLFNTHLDHVSDPQRRLGAAMLLHRARHEARVKPGVLIFVTGDFNRCGAYLNPLPYTFLLLKYGCSSAKGEDEGAYAVLTGAQEPPPVPDEFARRFPLPRGGDGPGSLLVMRDLRGAVPARLRVGGEWATFTGFERRKKDEECIDFVFGCSGGGWCVLSFYVFLTCGLIWRELNREAKNVFVFGNSTDDGMLSSDHRLVVADVDLS